MTKCLFLVIFIFIFYWIESFGQENQYLIQVKSNENMSEARGTQKITYYNLNNYPLESLYFRIADPDNEPRCQIQKITDLNGKKYDFSPSTEYLGVIEVKLKRPLKVNESTILMMDFSTALSHQPYYIFRYLANYWHPRIIPYHQGKLQPLNKEFASYRVEFEFPVEKKIVTSGEIVSETNISNSYKKVVSQIDQITNFGTIFLDDIEKQEREVDGIKVTVYHHADSAAWTAGLEELAADIVQFYVKEIGFYPQKIINIIPGSKIFGGGFPVASNIFAIHRIGSDDKDYIKGITAHEIAHTYWDFDYVLVPGEYGHWLGIGLGLYTDDFYSPSSRPYRWGYLQGAVIGYNTTIMQSNAELKKLNFDWNGVIDHSKSFTVIKMLEYVVGKEIFRKIFDTLLDRYKHKLLTVDDFQKVCEEISGIDLEWFFRPWLYTNNKLDYTISEVKTKKEEDKFNTRVFIKRTGQILMPVEIEITTLDSNKYIKTFPHDLSEGYVEFVTSSSLIDVQLDPSEKLPLISRVDNDLKRGIVIMSFNSGHFSTCLKFCDDVLAKFPEDGYILYLQSRSYKKLGRYSIALESFQKVIDLKDKDDTVRNLTPWCHIRRGYIFDQQGLRQLALDEYQKAVTLSDYRGSKEEAQKRLNEQFKEEI